MGSSWLGSTAAAHYRRRHTQPMRAAPPLAGRQTSQEFPVTRELMKLFVQHVSMGRFAHCP